MQSPKADKHDQNNHRRRSRSPYRQNTRHEARDTRSRSPRRRHHHHRHRRSPPPSVRLPFRQRQLHKDDLTQYRNLLADYLDVQKRIDIATISEDEVRGRWKSFLGKWNRKELAEGWYDPDMKARVDERFTSQHGESESVHWKRDQVSRTAESHSRPDQDLDRDQADEDQGRDEDVADDNGEDEDDYGPSLPDSANKRASGPAVPVLQDLQHRDELANEDHAARASSMRFARKLDQKQQAERMDELAPRADPGSRERQLEKRRAATDANRGFREAKSPGAAEVGDRDLMGGEDGGLDGYRARLKARDKIKNEREIRKEEVLRARAAEREERMAEHRRREEKTMETLKAIAKQRFG